MPSRNIPGVMNPAGEREILPKPEPPFRGHIARTAKDSTPDFPKGVEAPAGAPNVLLVLTDDVGFGASSTFGGPVRLPVQPFAVLLLAARITQLKYPASVPLPRQLP